MKRAVLITFIASLSGIVAVSQWKDTSIDAGEPKSGAAGLVADPQASNVDGLADPVVRKLPKLVDPDRLESDAVPEQVDGSPANSLIASGSAIVQADPADSNLPAGPQSSRDTVPEETNRESTPAGSSESAFDLGPMSVETEHGVIKPTRGTSAPSDEDPLVTLLLRDLDARLEREAAQRARLSTTETIAADTAELAGDAVGTKVAATAEQPVMSAASADAATAEMPDEAGTVPPESPTGLDTPTLEQINLEIEALQEKIKRLKQTDK